MKFYIAFALNLAALVLNIGLIVHDPRPLILRVFGAAVAAIGVRVMFPIVVGHLRDKGK